jgi:hypothetical protein
VAAASDAATAAKGMRTRVPPPQVSSILTAVRAKTDHPVFLAAYTTDPIFFYKEAPEDGGMWSPPQLSQDETVRARLKDAGIIGTAFLHLVVAPGF